jgi:cobyrinic acid a,c-diamide synthase
VDARGNVHASYLHVHWAAYPQIARDFVAAATAATAWA